VYGKLTASRHTSHWYMTNDQVMEDVDALQSTDSQKPEARAGGTQRHPLALLKFISFLAPSL
jgi:hypothetical protein